MRQDSATGRLSPLGPQIKDCRQAFRRMIVGLARDAYRKVNATPWGSSIASSRHLGWLRSKFVVMRGTDVHTVMDTLRTAGVEAWIVGGWGVDALLGVRTRRHGDLDVIVEADADNAERAVQALGAVGFRLAAETDGGAPLPHRYVLDDDAGHIVDILPVTFPVSRSAPRQTANTVLVSRTARLRPSESLPGGQWNACPRMCKSPCMRVTWLERSISATYTSCGQPGVDPSIEQPGNLCRLLLSGAHQRVAAAARHGAARHGADHSGTVGGANSGGMARAPWGGDHSWVSYHDSVPILAALADYTIGGAGTRRNGSRYCFLRFSALAYREVSRRPLPCPRARRAVHSANRAGSLPVAGAAPIWRCVRPCGAASDGHNGGIGSIAQFPRAAPSAPRAGNRSPTGAAG